MSPGTMLLCGGIVVFIAAIMIAVCFRVSGKKERRKLEEELKKDY